MVTGDQWYRHLRPGSFNYIRPPKLLIKGIDRRLTVGFLKGETVFNGANCPGFIMESKAPVLKPILGLMNSRLISSHMRVVYQLYGLSDEEVKIVEEATK